MTLNTSKANLIQNFMRLCAVLNVSNPRVVADSSMASGQRATWDCVWFGSYPQEVVTDAAKGTVNVGGNLVTAFSLGSAIAPSLADNIPTVAKAMNPAGAFLGAMGAKKSFENAVERKKLGDKYTELLDQMLERVATWYDQELDEQIRATVSLLEPMLIVFVGAIIAIIAISIFAPITSAIVQLS